MVPFLFGWGHWKWGWGGGGPAGVSTPKRYVPPIKNLLDAGYNKVGWDAGHSKVKVGYRVQLGGIKCRV